MFNITKKYKMTKKKNPRKFKRQNDKMCEVKNLKKNVLYVFTTVYK